jgi:replicative DNA helicase
MDRDRTVIEGLTRLQHELADPVMVISEVTKGTFTNTDAMASILGTGRNAYRADAVMLLKRVEDSDTHRIDLIIDKGRDGMERGKVSLEWDKDYTRLSEVAR